MNYKHLAKHFIYEAAMRANPNQFDAGYLLPGTEKFSYEEFQKFREAVDAERDRMKQKLIDKGILNGRNKGRK